MAQEPAEYFRGLSAVYTDNIRASDFKANIVIFFLSIVMGPVTGAHDKYPWFMPLPVLLAPFLAVFFCLFLAILPRYARRGHENFIVSRTAKPEDFRFHDDAAYDVEQLRLRCAILSDILYWKTTCLQTSFVICISSVVVAAGLVAIYGH